MTTGRARRLDPVARRSHAGAIGLPPRGESVPVRHDLGVAV